jgi:RimJ/RimL family protein N-acetyltransferase
MGDQVVLQPVAEDDMQLLYRHTSDPSVTRGEWFGWQDPGRFRRQWADNGLLTADGGMLIVTASGERLGFVSWIKHQLAQTSYCWRIGVAITPEARGHGYGTEAQQQLVRYLFAHAQVTRIEATTEITNMAEQRAGTTRVRIHPGGRLARRSVSRWRVARPCALQRAA